MFGISVGVMTWPDVGEGISVMNIMEKLLKNRFMKGNGSQRRRRSHGVRNQEHIRGE